MTDDDDVRPLTVRDFAAVEQVLDEVIPHTPTRRMMLGQAGKVLAAVAGGGALLAAGASPALASTGGTDHQQSGESILTVLASFEVFGVTFLTQAVKRAPGTPSEQFATILKAANSSEYDHLLALQKLGATPLSTRIWVPDKLFGGGGIGLFQSIEKDEDIEISAYLVGVTTFAHAGDVYGARLCAEALGTESVHRALARSAQGMLAHKPDVPPNNRGFESFPYRSATKALHTLESVGVGFGTKGATPGAFYDFPGDPLHTGTGVHLTSNTPDTALPYSSATP